MKFKNINLIYFSPTGGTKNLTDIICNNFSSTSRAKIN